MALLKECNHVWRIGMEADCLWVQRQLRTLDRNNRAELRHAQDTFGNGVRVEDHGIGSASVDQRAVLVISAIGKRFPEEGNAETAGSFLQAGAGKSVKRKIRAKSGNCRCDRAGDDGILSRTIIECPMALHMVQFEALYSQ